MIGRVFSSSLREEQAYREILHVMYSLYLLRASPPPSPPVSYWRSVGGQVKMARSIASAQLRLSAAFLEPASNDAICLTR